MAAHGLNQVPANVVEWRDAIYRHGLQRRTLEQLWMEELDHFFNEDHINDAIKFMEGNLLGLHMLQTLCRHICVPEDALTITLPKYSGTLAGELGPFSMLTNLFNQLEDRSIQASIEERRTLGLDSMTPCSTQHAQTQKVQRIRLLKRPTRRISKCHPTSQQHSSMQFRARVDGSILFSLSVAGMPREAAIFEVKRAPRKGKDSVPILAQQAMEHAVYIWKCHTRDEMVILPNHSCTLILTRAILTDEAVVDKKSQAYHTIMVAQDHLGFHIIIGTYNNTYLEYIFGPGSQSVLPARGTNKFPFLQIQELGPFNIKMEDHLRNFLRIMLAFILWQLEKSGDDAMFKEAFG
ncbi:hypothetical protein MGYG_05169 [Nannizzia gypsea CBS 118893]|uniref:Uncharacterized protein n=1 Tax=Arthroderma gypseum (strain ATCC MYA-4604 / CBS 118893) TaxID=535722 RepID=E4UYK3_ARTGP|nr:hypothetical protein MGYG_05169 [Nannizzia gypsea CBS 118893]EFR02166.1 hypothetical protein MGYG_05169 [Nannizzia gypsea CBS 118893]